MPTDGLVLVDATSVPASRSGVGRYVDGLIGALDGPFVVACQQRDAEHYRRLAPGATVLPQSARLESVPLRLIWEQLRLPAIARRAGARVIHSPHYTLPLLSGLRRVVTFHDATFFSDPGVHTRAKRLFFRAWIRISSRLADRIVVPSRATASEITRYLGREREYDVAYHGVDPEVFHPPTSGEIAAAASAFGLTATPWIGFLGTIEPRKNLPQLIRAYAAVVSRWRHERGPVPVLALAGNQGWENEVQGEIDRVPEPGRVVQLGYIELDSVRAFLGGATIVSYPSLGEGFGLPVLEGMASGAAVLTTERLALPEVGGDAVAYSDTDAASIAAAIELLLDSPEERARLGALGIERAREFTWARCAAVHRAAYAAALAG